MSLAVGSLVPATALPTDLPHRLRGGLAWEMVLEELATQPAPRTVPEQWFEQKLNHSDPNSPTFKQL